MKPRLRDLLKGQKEALRKASPKSRDRLRHRVMVLEVVARAQEGGARGVMGYPWRSIPRDDLQTWFLANWSYVMPDFDKPGNYIVEWRSDIAPVEPSRVPETTSQENADGGDRRQPA